jgi:hypothetical protein
MVDRPIKGKSYRVEVDGGETRVGRLVRVEYENPPPSRPTLKPRAPATPTERCWVFLDVDGEFRAFRRRHIHEVDE